MCGLFAGNLLPEEVASLIISQLLQSAEESCGTSIDKAVISVSSVPSISVCKTIKLAVNDH